jgi:broad specificity phosphatase PhoE
MLSSSERKAVETARLVADELAIPHQIIPELGEHDRQNEPYHDRQRFLQLVEELLRHPEKHVFGSESGAEALARFEGAVARIVADYPAGNIAAVTHGTVLSLYVASHSALDAYQFWQELAQPALVTFTLPEMALVEVVPDAGQGDSG